MGILLTTGGPMKFPELGLSIDSLIEGFDILGIHVSLVGIMIALAMFLGLFITERLAKKSEQNTEHYLDLAIRLVVVGIVGARAGYVISHWQYFVSAQGDIFRLGDGGMSVAGAIVAGLLVSFIYCRKKKLSWLQVCDTAMPGIVVGQILAAVGCFFGRSMLGTYSDGIFSMQVALQDVDTRAVTLGRSTEKMVQGDFLQVHPVSLYETLILVVLLILLLILWNRIRIHGIVLAVYLIGYGVMIFSMEFIRLDSQKIMGSRFSVEHIGAIVLVVAGILILTEQLRKYSAERKAQPKS